MNHINKIFCDDAVKVMRCLPHNSIDLVVTSPPYDNLRDYHEYEFNIEKIVAGLFNVIKPGGVVIWVVGDATIKGSESGTSFRQALKFIDVGFRLHDTMIFEKNTSSFPARRDGNRYTQIFEYMFVFSKGSPKTANLICDKKNKWAGWTNWGKKTDRQKDGTLKEKGNIKPVPTHSARNNIWKYTVGGKFGHTDKLAYEHPACVDTLTECLTIDGWKNHDTLSIGDLIASYNIDTDCLEWKSVTNVHSYNHNGPSVQIEGRRISILMNERHRNVAKRGYGREYEMIQAKDIKQTHMLKCSAALKRNNKMVDTKLAAVLGWFISEGWYEYNSRGDVYSASISQSSANSEYVRTIRRNCDAIKNAGFVEYSRDRTYKNREYTEFSFCLRGDIRHDIFKMCGKNKDIPRDILSWNIESMREFFNSAIMGDGHFRGNSSSFSFKQKNVETLHTMQAIGCLLGYDTYLCEKHRYVEFINQEHKLLRNSKGSIIKNINYDGVMWCPEVEHNATFVARRNGKTYITGNTFPEALVRDHILTWTNEGDVVLDTMCGSGTTCKIAKQLNRKYIGIDVSEEYCKLTKERLKLV